MGFASILGQPTAVQTLSRALASGRVHHAYCFEGPAGVGKEKTAFRFAQALVCDAGEPLGCERCKACHRALTFSEEEPRVPLHPDVVLVQRGLYPASLIGSQEATGIGVEQVRRIVLARAGFTPHEGRAMVFIIRDADELTVQAANALLKTLEEPSPRTHFVLLTSRPNRLLDTIRSRTLALRFGSLPDAVVAQIAGENGVDAKVAELAQGSAERALELADPAALAQKADFAEAARAALTASDFASGLSLADSRATDRDGLREQLAFFAQGLAAESRATVASEPPLAERLAHRYALVVTAMNELERNVQPALVLEALLYRMRKIV